MHCTVTMDEVEGKGHLIVASELDVSGRAEGIDEAGFESAVQRGRRGLLVLGADPRERVR